MTATLLIGSTLAGTAEAATVYSFDGFTYAPTTTTANTTASNFSFTSADGISICWATVYPDAACGAFGSSIGQFSIAPLAGYSLTITGLSFDGRVADAFGPTAFQVLTSADGFTTPLISGPLTPSAPAFTHHIVPVVLFNLTNPFAVRFVSTGRDDYPMSAWYLDNVTLHVEAVPLASTVPEPTSLVLLGSGLVGFIAKRRRATS